MFEFNNTFSCGFSLLFFPLLFTVKFPPNFVNIHVKHPPEASVQFHQVSRIDSTSSGQKAKTKPSQSGHSQVSYQSIPFQKTQKIHSTYSHQQPMSHMFPISGKTQLGRCFQETIGTQVRKCFTAAFKNIQLISMGYIPWSTFPSKQKNPAESS